MAVAPATLQQAIDGMYVVMYNRAADSKGYTYWANYAAGTLGSTASTAQFTALANGFYAATPTFFNATYGALTDIQFVQQLYINMGGNAGDQAGVLFWTSILAGGTSRQTLVGQFVQAFINFDPSNVTGLSPADIAAAQLRQQTFLNKIVVSESYASASATNAFLIPTAASAADPAFVAATNVIQGVTAQDGSVGIAQNQIAAAVTAGNPSPIVGQAIITYLTVGQDVVSNVANVQGDLSAFAYNAIGPTLNSNDILNNVTNFTITDSWGLALDELPAGIQLTNISNMILNTAGNAGASGLTLFDTTGVTGLKTLTVTSQGKLIDFVKSSATTDVTVNQNSNTGGVDVTGGKNVTVNSAGAIGVLVGNTGLGAALGPFLGVVPNANYLPTGDVTVNVTAPASLGVGILGGKNISVTITGVTNPAGVQIGNTPANTGNSLAGGLTNPTGNITVVDAGPNALGIVAFGGKDVNITTAGGSVTVGDATGVLASNQPTGKVTINDNVLVGFNNLAPVGSAPGAALINKGYIKVAGVSNEVLADGTPIATNNDYSTSKFVPLPAAIVAIGGTDVTVNTNTGANITVGGDSTIVGSLATGNITVSNLASDLNAAFGIGGYGVLGGFDNITGGVNVTVTEAGNGVTIGSAATQAVAAQGNPWNAADNATGTVKVTETVVSHTSVTVDGGNGVTLNLQGQNAFVGTNTGTAGAQVVNQASVFTGNGLGLGNGAVTVLGGTTVSVATTGGSVTVGGKATNGSVQVPTGNVTITDTFSGGSTGKDVGGANNDAFVVLGGAQVSVNVKNGTSGAILVGAAPVLNGSGTAIANLAFNPTGNVTIRNGAGGQNNAVGVPTVFTNGATTVDIVGNAGTIADVNSFANASAVAIGVSTLSTVLLDSVYGGTTIDSNAIANVTVANSQLATPTNLTIGALAGFTAIPAHALNLTLNNDGKNAAGGMLTVTDATATAITINTLDTAAAGDFLNLTAGKMTALNLANANKVTFGALTVGANTVITSTGAGAVNLGNVVDVAHGGPQAGGVVKSITSTTASITATINADTTTFAGGSAGNNSVTVESTFGLLNGQAANITAGGTNNTVTVTNVQALYNPLLFPLAPIINDFTGFQNLGLGGPVDAQPGASGKYNVAGFANIIVNKNAGTAGALDISNASTGAQLSFTGTPVGAVKWEFGAAAPLTININAPVATLASADKSGIQGLTVDTTASAGGGVSTVTFNSLNATKAGGGNQITIIDPTTTTLNFTGNGAIQVADTQANKVKTVNASGASGPVNLVDFGGGVTLNATAGATVTGGAGALKVNFATGGGVSANVVDLLTSGSGGVTATLGAGNQLGANTGSETVNLAASTAVRDTLTALFVPGAAGFGTNANIIGFQNFVAGSRGAADAITLDLGPAQTVVTAATPTVTIGGNVYALSNGIFTALTPGLTTLTMLNDIKTYMALTAPVNRVGAIQLDGSTYVIDNSVFLTANEMTVLQLTGVTGITGFALAADAGVSMSSGNTVAITNAAFVNAGNPGSALVSSTWNDAGFAADTFTTGAAGITNTYTGLGNFAIMTAGAGLGTNLGNLVVQQVGTSSELLVKSAGLQLDNLTYQGAIVIDSTGGAVQINKQLIDAPNTDTTIWFTGTNTVTVNGISDTALTTINASNLTNALSLGTAATPLTQAGLTVLGNKGALTIFASGAGDHINGDATGASPGDFVVANGAGDVILLGSGANTVTANGAGDTITIGNLTATATTANTVIGAHTTIAATGIGDTITFANAAGDGGPITWAGTQWVNGGSAAIGIGNNSTVNFGTQNVIAAGNFQSVVVTGDLAGGTTAGGTSVAGLSFITLTNVQHGIVGGGLFNDAGERIVLNNAATELTAGGTFGASQVNVSAATSLAQAFDIAAAAAGLSQTTVGAGHPGVIAAHTGVFDWFQFGGNTYIVEAINNTNSAATHTALQASDAIIKITGVFDLTASQLVIGTAVIGNHIVFA